MRILAFFFHFPPMNGGGAVVSFEIAKTLCSMGNEITVLVPDVDWSGVRYEPPQPSNLKVIRVETPSKSNLKIAARRCKDNLKNKGEQLGKNEKFDFVFTIFHPFHLVPNAAVSCAKKLGIPSIIKIDDAVYAKSSGLKSIQRRIEKMYSQRSLSDASRILVPNEATKNLVNEFYKIPKEKISIVPNGIDLSLFHNKNQNRQKIIIFTGVMYYHRGLDVLFEAMPRIVKNHPDVRLLLLGDGPEMQRLQNLSVEKNLNSNIEFKGWINREEIPNYTANASIGIGPLKLTDVTANALPIKVLEYMASSLPIIAKRGTLPEDILKNDENGYLIESSEDLSDKIIKLLDDQVLKQRMGMKSLEMVQKFSWNNIVNMILDNYRILT